MTALRTSSRSAQAKTAFVGLALVCGAAAQAQSSSLATDSEHRLGVSLIGYKYDEPARPGYPDGVMTLKATMLSVDYSGTYAFTPQWPNTSQGWFVRGEFQYAVGDADYSSPVSGRLDGTENWYYEFRGQLGRDFQMKGYVLAPYVGLGFRHLYNDLRGFRLGYARENDLQTASMGFTHRMRLSGGTRLSSTFEYMHLLKGLQRSKGYPVGNDVSNKQNIEHKQNSGYGLRLSSMWRLEQWSFGPALTYWNISDSDTVNGVLEPKNTTTEIAVKAAYHF